MNLIKNSKFISLSAFRNDISTKFVLKKKFSFPPNVKQVFRREGQYLKFFCFSNYISFKLIFVLIPVSCHIDWLIKWLKNLIILFEKF